MSYLSEDNSSTLFKVLAAVLALAFLLLLAGGSILQMSDHPGFYSVPITDLPSYHYAPLLYVLCIGITFLVTFFILENVAAEVSLLNIAGMAAAISFVMILIIPDTIQYLDEERAFSGQTTRETRVLRIDGTSYWADKNSVHYRAVVNPYHITNPSSGVWIDQDAYNAITVPNAIYCLSLTVEHAGSNQRLVEPRDVFQVADLQECPAGAI